MSSVSLSFCSFAAVCKTNNCHFKSRVGVISSKNESMNDDDSIHSCDGVHEETGQFVKKIKKKKIKKKKSNLPFSDEASQQFQFCSERADFLILNRTSARGRFLIAAREIPLGALVFREKPICLVAHPSKGICEVCGLSYARLTDTNIDNRTCSLVCNDSAVVDETLGTRIAEVAQLHRCDADLLRGVFQLLCRHFPSTQELNPIQHAGASPRAFFADNGNFITATTDGLMNLESHEERQDSRWLASIQAAIVELVQLLPTSVQEIPNIIDYGIGYACRINTNAYGILDLASSKDSLGFGLFPAVGLCINHSCAPNVSYTFSADGCMEYRTMKPIAAGEELCVEYIDISTSTQSRRLNLQEKRFFLCMCERCSAFDELISSLAASQCAGGSLVALKEDLEWMMLGSETTEVPSAGKNKKSGFRFFALHVCLHLMTFTLFLGIFFFLW